MSAVLADPAPQAFTGQSTPLATAGQSLIDAVREIATGDLAAMVDAIDRQGTYPQAVLKRLGEVGALRAHLRLDGTLLSIMPSVVPATTASRSV